MVHEQTHRQPMHAESSTRNLTRRETEILDLTANGLSNREIARTLFLSEHTVLGYVKHVLLKLGAHSRLQAVVIGLREGLIEMPQGNQAPR
jgi:DNA-binding CsgD family transcriptional regulator